MRMNFLFLIFCFSLNLNAYAFNRNYPKMMPDMEGNEYTQLLNQNQVFRASSTDEISQIIAVGTRNLDWLVHINSMRKDKLSFTTRETRNSYPIDAPSIYNEKIVVD